MAHEIPRKFRHLALGRNPVQEILAGLHPVQAAEYREYCERIEDKIEAGKGLWFQGDRGTGKTTLAMLISIHAIRARRSVGIYTAPKLLEAIRSTYAEDSKFSLTELVDRLRTVDLLHIEDLMVPRTNEWVLEQLYTIVNDRYEEERAVIFTADVEKVNDLAEQIGYRTMSRLIDVCGDPIQMHGSDHRAPWLERPASPEPAPAERFPRSAG